MSALSDRSLTVNGLPLRALSGGNGPLILCLHSYALTADMWRPVLPGLIEAGYAVLAVDLPGHGRSFRPKRPFGVADIARVMRDLLVTLSVDRVCVMGNSLGGGIACELALDYPEQVARLVLVSAFGLHPQAIPFLWRPRFWTHLAWPTVIQLLFGPRPWITRLRAEMTFYDPARVPPQTFLPDYGGGWLHNYWGRTLVTLGLFGRHALPAQHRAFVRRRSDLNAPTLIVWGEDDQILPVAQAQAGQALVPNSKLRLFPRCGHAPMVEYPEAFTQTVVSFLSE